MSRRGLIDLNKAAAVAYTGAGDIVAFDRYYGLRAYTAALAGNTVVRIIRASDSTQQDFATLANGNLDIASIATFLTSTTGKIVTLYDQLGSGNNLTQATDGSRPAYITNVIGSFSGVNFSSSTSMATASVFVKSTQPVSGMFVAKRYSGTGYGSVIDSSTGNNQFGFGNAANNLYLYLGSSASNVSGATDGSFHAAQSIDNGASSFVYIDGTKSGTLSPGGQGYTAALGSNVANAGNYYLLEMGVPSSTFTDTTAGNLTTNQKNYWGF